MTCRETSDVTARRDARPALWIGIGVAVIAWLTGLNATEANATGIDQLKTFLSSSKSGQTTFEQVVQNGSGRKPQLSSGTFAYSRPGKFRWAYDRPYPQLIVGDGEKLWIYDRDLNQVVVRKLDRALGATPAALLAGDDALDKNFQLTEAPSADGLDYVDAKPKTADTGFESIRIGLKDNKPRSMELHDSFGHVTQLTFSSFERNPAIDAATFHFVPPQGADVVGE